MVRRWFTILSAVSLGLGVLVAALWIRSCFHHDVLWTQTKHVSGRYWWQTTTELHVLQGTVSLVWTEDVCAPADQYERIRQSAYSGAPIGSLRPAGLQWSDVSPRGIYWDAGEFPPPSGDWILAMPAGTGTSAGGPKGAWNVRRGWWRGVFQCQAWLPVLMILPAGWLAWWLCDRRRVPPGHCRNCRYDLTGNVSGRCPECGVMIPPEVWSDERKRGPVPVPPQREEGA